MIVEFTLQLSYYFIEKLKIWNCQFFHYKQEQFEFSKKKHTCRKASAIATS